MSRAPEPSRIDLLELDVDARLLELWNVAVAELEPDELERVGPFMRAAYARGYEDALTEPAPGELHRTHGYRQPRRRAGA